MCETHALQHQSLITPCQKGLRGVLGWGGTGGAFPMCVYL